MSTVSQNQAVKVEIKEFKNSHFLEKKTAPRTARMQDHWSMANVLKATSAGLKLFSWRRVRRIFDDPGGRSVSHIL
jgi:hypothetical protein